MNLPADERAEVKRRFVEFRAVFAGVELRLVAAIGAEVTVGSSAQCSLVLADPTVPPVGAYFTWRGDTELAVAPAAVGHSTPLRVNDETITAQTAVQANDTVTIGETTVTWNWVPPEEAPTIARDPRPSPGESASAAALVGQVRKERYQRGAELGRGGMGKVVQALENPLQRAVALKVLLDRGDDEDRKRFIREARITGQLEHPSIVPVHELNVDGSGHIFYTMKLVQGVTLLRILRDLAGGNLETLQRYSLAALLTIFQKICDAVAFAHAQPEPIIHRDLKPENIMVGDYGEVLVMDWGAAKILHKSGGPEGLEIPVIPSEVEGSRGETLKLPTGNQATGNKDAEELNGVYVTRAGSVMGTPGYMAPEQARGQAALADERTDIYALGALLYALVTLEAPARISAEDAQAFDGHADHRKDASSEFTKRVTPFLSGGVRQERRLHPPRRSMPESLVAVIAKAMAFRPANRFGSVQELQADVAAYQSGFATNAEQARTWRRFRLLVGRHKVLFASIATTFAILIAATAISLHQRQTALRSNEALALTLQRASLADHEAARQHFRAGAWREGIALMGRSLTFWPDNREAANYLLSAIRFARGDGGRLPIFGVHQSAWMRDAAFSPNGRYFATASQDGTTCVWDTATGAQVGKTLHHTGPCCLPCFSPDSLRILTTGEDSVSILWDVQTGEALTQPMRHGRPDLDSLSIVTSGAFSPDGKQLLTASLDHTARIWDAAKGKEIAQLVNPNRVADAVFSPDGTRILTSYWYGGAMLWDAKTFQPIGAQMAHGATVRRAMFTPDGNRIVTSSLDKTARIWDGHSGEPLCPPLVHPDFVWYLDLSPDGKLFATACYDKKVRLWSVADGSPVGVPMEHEGPVDTVAFSPNGKRLVSASRDKTARLWDVATCQPIGAPMRHDESVLRAIFHPDGTKILSVGWDGAGYLWKAEAPAYPGEIIPIPGQVRSIEFAGDDDRLFVATMDGQAGLWSLSKQQFITPVASHREAISAAVFHSASEQFATAGVNGTIRFWSSVTGEEIGETNGGNGPIAGLVFSADGGSLFAAYLGGSVLQRKVPDGTQIGKVMKHSEKMDALAVAPSGTELATGARDDFLHFWELPAGNALPRTIRHGNPVLAIATIPMDIS